MQLLREMGRRLNVSEDYLATGVERGDEAASLLDAEIALRLDETDVAGDLLRSALQNATTRDEKARALTGLGQLALREGKTREAIALLEQARGLQSGDLADSPGLADTLGRAYALVDDLDAAVVIFQAALDSAEARNDPVQAVRFAVLLANASIDKEDFALAKELLERTLSLAPDSGDPIFRARLYWSHSRLHTMQKNSATAARYARKALEILELTENTFYTACAYQLLAHIELDRNRPEEALELIQKGFVLLAESGGDHLMHARFRLEEARALLQLGRRDDAASMAMESVGMLADALPHEAGRGYALVAEVFEELGDMSRAKELYELAAEMLGPIPSRYLLDVYKKLAQILETEGRKDEALAVLKRAVATQAASG